jgi:hypothetical protein
MKRNLFLLFTCFICLLLYSCEGSRCGNGIVLDKQTSQPLDSVICTVVTNNGWQDVTDSTGHFATCNAIGGCVPHCRDIEIEFSKTGYKTIRVENPDSAVIYLERQ